MRTLKKLITVVGPTASGKTALALHLASAFGGELINADSRQVYKGMDIGTAKSVPSAKLKTKNLKLHLIDIVEPDERFTVAEYKKLAIRIINDIQGRKNLPILVGGTGLYIKAVVENLEFPRVPAQKKLRAELEQKGAGELYEMIKAIDPKTAKVIDRFNRRRLARALEVVLATKKSFLAEKTQGSKMYDALQIAIDMPKEILFQNIERRVQKMMQSGLEEEVSALVRRYGWTNILTTSIGYKEWKGYAEGGKSKKKVIEEIIKDTKGLVKKQLTWLRHQEGIQWIKDRRSAAGLVKNFLHTYNDNYAKT